MISAQNPQRKSTTCEMRCLGAAVGIKDSEAENKWQWKNPINNTMYRETEKKSSQPEIIMSMKSG